MKHLAIATAVILAGTSAQAFDRMLAGDCQQTAEKIVELFDLVGPETPQLIAEIAATPDGWCRINGRQGAYEDAEFDTLDWRMDKTSMWTVDGVPPLALEIRATGLEPDEMQEAQAPSKRPPLTAHVILRQEPDAGQLILERFAAENEAGDRLLVSGVFERVFLSSPSMMQVSMGSAAFKAGLLSMTLTGEYENPFAFEGSVEVTGGDEAQRRGAFDTISQLPDGVIDDASRAELTAFAGDLPAPVGTLEVTAHSERGLGLMQVGMAMYQTIGSFAAEDGDSSGLALMLDGITLSADWTPATPVAD